MKPSASTRAVLLLVLVSAAVGWLERRPPRWMDRDPLLEPFGLDAPVDEAALLEQLLHPPAPPAPEPRIVDPNRATREEWIALPGIGPATADRILAWTGSGRQFRRAEDLERVHGIGPARVEALRQWLRFPVAEEDSSSVRVRMR